ncbi:MAG: ABC transporter ATP-binding protein [Candidatus Helarchaeota archaeon]|nr:ABC transporter ATP-binding protein [Candidatus Helarchaeota archaeon]
MSMAIETKNLTKVYDGNTVVDHLSFQVKRGELLSLLGPNGAGKSTIINMLTTILKPDEGTAFINGHDIRKDKEKVRQIIGITPQELVFYDELNARENLIFFGLMHGIDKKKLKADAEEILEQLGLADRTDKTKNFSGGMKRRLNLAINIIMDPEIFFLDEPTAGLDPQARHVVWDYIEEVRKQGKTIVLTTHYMEEAELLSDRVIIIDRGEIIAEGTPEDLKEKYSEQNIMEVKFKDETNITELKEKLKDLEFVKDIIIGPDKEISVYFDGGIINFTKILNQDIISDVTELEMMRLRQNSLEDVFLKLTGRRLRD